MNEIIMIVEDDKALNRGIALIFEQDGMTVKKAYTKMSAQKILSECKPDLIVLDINLPDGNGLDFCREIRANGDIPIILLTANDMETDIVTGFEYGCDDYITKPFSLAVLRAHVMAVLRRKNGSDSRLIIGNLMLDFDKMHFTKSDILFTLSRTEQKLLRKLTSNRGNILTREVLMESLYANESDFVDENALSVLVNRLRSKIEDNPQNPVYIKTVYGLGYIWTGGTV